MALNWIRVNHRSLDNWCLNNERCRAALADAHCVMRSSPSSLSTPCLCSARLLQQVLFFFLGGAECQQLCATPHYPSQSAHCLKALSHLRPRPGAVGCCHLELSMLVSWCPSTWFFSHSSLSAWSLPDHELWQESHCASSFMTSEPGKEGDEDCLGAVHWQC